MSYEGKILLYTTPTDKVVVDVRYEADTIWLTQKQIAELFGVNVRTINEHLQNILKSKELSKDAVIRIFRTTAADGKNYA